MKFSDIVSEQEFRRLREQPPPVPTAMTPGPANIVAQPGQQPQVQDPQAAAKAQAMAVQQMQDRKKEIQDQIKAKEQELIDLRKQLATM